MRMISIVMPVYNTGEYLVEALNSILVQTYSDYEIICVDDCSDDERTLSVLQEYDKSYENMKIIHNFERKGAAESRNIGMENASGKYVIFLDSDDIFSEILLESVIQVAESTEADVLIFNTNELDNRKISSKKLFPRVEYISNNKSVSWLVECGLVPWNKIIRRDFLNFFDLTFQNLTSCNDVFFSCMVLILARKIYYLDSEGLVSWRSGRIGQISSHRNPMNLLYAVKEIIEDSRVQTEIYPSVIFVLLRQGISELRQSSNNDFSKKFYIEVSNFLSDYLNYIDFSSKEGVIAKLFINYTYDKLWWEVSNMYSAQIGLYINNIIDLEYLDNAILWGCGRRGQAFLEVLNLYNMHIGIYDIDELNARRTAEKYEMNVIPINEVKEVDCIIASNKKIWNDIREKYPEMKVVNLEQYCMDF